MFRTFPSTLLIGALAPLINGCSSVEETEKVSPPPVQEVQKPPDPPMNFATQTDTVNTVPSPPQAGETPAFREPIIRFMVQIGAFKDAQNASRIQTLARERYHLPVFNDFNPELMLYQIRLGFFETREAARAFRDQMERDHPEEYKDAWVAQLTQ